MYHLFAGSVLLFIGLGEIMTRGHRHSDIFSERPAMFCDLIMQSTVLLFHVAGIYWWKVLFHAYLPLTMLTWPYFA